MQLSEWILMVMDKLGLVGVALMMFLENVFPPIPSELIMPLQDLQPPSVNSA